MATASVGTALRYIGCLFSRGTVTGLSDGQLLGRYVEHRDDVAFSALLARHGPMVMGVCRGLLRDPHDAEDAFQATFLILVRKAGTIQVADALGGWLHRVAHRVSVQALADASRRRTEERNAGAEAAARTAPAAELDDLKPFLHAEIDRLPARLRYPLVLCDLEGLTREEAACRLRWTEGTVRGRLAKARVLLRARLNRRGVAVSVAALVAALTENAKASMPEAAVVSAITRPAAALPAAALATRVMRAVFLARLLWTSVALGFVAVAATTAGLLVGPALARFAWDQGPLQPPPAAAPQPAPRREEPPKKDGNQPRPKLSPAQIEAILKAQGPLRDYEFHGRVVDPAGKPVAGAKIYLIGAMRPGEASATTDADGRFRFTQKGRDPLKAARVAAAAEGYTHAAASQALQFQEMNTAQDPPDTGRDLTITLAPDYPIEGQVVDLEGRPVTDVSVRVGFLFIPRQGNLDAWLRAVKAREDTSGDLEFKYLKRDFLVYWFQDPAVKTDAQGRFVVRGIGREQLALIRIDGPTIRPLDEVRVLTRPGAPLEVLQDPRFPQFGSVTYHGSTPRLTVAPGRVVEGVVRDAQTGAGLAGALISSVKLADSKVWNNAVLSTTADAQGRYRLLGLPRGAGNIIDVWPKQRQTYPPAQVEVPNPPGSGPIALELSLPRGITIEGRVSDAQTGKPLQRSKVGYHVAVDNPNLARFPGFRADIPSHSQWFGVTSGPDGRFQIAGLPGRGVLVVGSNDRSYPSAVASGEPPREFVPHISFVGVAIEKVDIPADATTYHRDITLQAGRALDVSIVDTAGKPVEGALIRGLKGTEMGDWDPVGSTSRVVGLQRARNDAQGKPVPVRTLVAMQRPRQLAGWIDLKGDEPGPIRLKLEPWATATGRFVNPAGKPRPEVILWVGARHAWLGGDRISHEPTWVRTDADGRFRIEGLAPGLTYEFTIGPPPGQSRPDYFTIQAPPGLGPGHKITFAPTRPGEAKDLGTIVVGVNPAK